MTRSAIAETRATGQGKGEPSVRDRAENCGALLMVTLCGIQRFLVRVMRNLGVII